MTRVVVKDGDIDSAWKTFRAKLAHSGVPSEYKKHREYKKPGVVRREKVEEGKRNRRKRNRNNDKRAA